MKKHVLLDLGIGLGIAIAGLVMFGVGVVAEYYL